MRRALVASTLAAAGAALACNAILGIDSDVVEPVVAPVVVVSDAQFDAAPRVLLTATGPSTIVQGGSVEFDVIASRTDETDKRPIGVFCASNVPRVRTPAKITVDPADGGSTKLKISADVFSLRNTIATVELQAEGRTFEIKLTVTGAIDETFGGQGFARPTAFAEGRLDEADVGLLVEGEEIVVAYRRKQAMAFWRFDKNGRAGRGFEPNDAGVSVLGAAETFPHDLVRSADGVWVVAGGPLPPPRRPIFVRVEPTTGKRQSVGPLPLDGGVSFHAALPVPQGVLGVGSLRQDDGGIRALLYQTVLDASTTYTPLASPGAWDVRDLVSNGAHVDLVGTALGRATMNRYFSNGSPDPAFAAVGAAGIESIGHAGAAGGDGALYVAGASGAAALRSPAIFKFAPSGQVDPSFGDAGVLTRDLENDVGVLHDIVRLSDGRLIAIGWVGSSAAHSALAIQISAAGAIERTFGVEGAVTLTTGDAYEFRKLAIQVQPDGKEAVLAAGVTERGANDIRAFVVRLLP